MLLLYVCVHVIDVDEDDAWPDDDSMGAEEFLPSHNLQDMPWDNSLGGLQVPSFKIVTYVLPWSARTSVHNDTCMLPMQHQALHINLQVQSARNNKHELH
jgi:hypothetical protein